jgi:ribonuclease HI
VPRTRSKQARHAGLQTTERVLELYEDGPTEGVFTDGSSVPNPGPGGWGAVYVVGGEVMGEEFGRDPETTNNRMELTALIHGAELVPPGRATTVYTDSRLAVNTITQWAAGWEKQSWKRKSGPVENLDLVKQAFYTFRRRPELDLRWIRAHVGYRWNEYADALASRWRLGDG